MYKPPILRIRELLNFEYLHLKKYVPQANLFWLNEKEFVNLWQGEATPQFILFQADGKNKNLFLGYQQERMAQLPQQNARGTRLRLYPQYFQYYAGYGAIWGLSFTTTENVAQCFAQLVQIKNLSIKVFGKSRTKEMVYEHLGKQMQVLASQDTLKNPLNQVIRKQQGQYFEQQVIDMWGIEENLVEFSLLIEVKVESKEALFSQLEKIKTIVRQYQGIIDDYFLQQRLACEKMYLWHEDTSLKEKTLLTSSTFAQTVPLAQLQLHDKNGMKLGYDVHGNNVHLDMWLRQQQRVNSNFIILGQSGTGKTTLLKKIVALQMKTVQCFILDPESEYAEITKEKEIWYHYDVNQKDNEPFFNMLAETNSVQQKNVHFVLTELFEKRQKEIQETLLHLLEQIWQYCNLENTQAKMLVIDESYFLFAAENQQVVSFLRNIIKRARKYNLAIGIVTQNLMDFKNKEIKHLLLPIIDNCTYKFIFQLGSYDLVEFLERIQIENRHQHNLLTLERGECLLMAGNRYGYLKVEKEHEFL